MAEKLQEQATDMAESIAERKTENVTMLKSIDEKTIQCELEQIRLLELKIIDVTDLIASIYPYTKNGGRGMVSEEDALHKMGVMQGEVDKMKKEYAGLCDKHNKEHKVFPNFD